MPEWPVALRARLASLRLSPAREAAIVDELSQHLEDRRQELISSGVAPDTATALIRAELERADLLTPRLAVLRQAQWAPSPTPGVPRRGSLSGWWQDVRYAGRALRRDRSLTLIAVLTLAFGVGLNTAMFGFMNALLFRPLPFPESDRLVRLFRTTAEDRYGGFSPADYLALRQAEGAVGRFGAYQPSHLVPSDPGLSAEWLRVSANLFDVLGVQPVRGRPFRAEDELPGTDRVVLISTALWQTHFGGAADIVGRTIQANGDSYEVIGVLPSTASDHRLFQRVGLFSPLSFDDGLRTERRGHTITVLGRRAPSVSEAQAHAFVASMGSRMAADFPAENAGSQWRSEGLPDSNTGPKGRAMLAMLLGLSAFVLLIACSNLANLLLARAIDRTRDIAVRTALGASRMQLVRMVALESVLLAAAGGAGALLVAAWTANWLQANIVDGGGPVLPIVMDWRVLSFAAAASLSTVLFCGMAPALFTTRIATSDALKGGGRGATAPGGHTRARNAFIAGQFALTLILLAGAAFFVRGAMQMWSRDHGWSAEGVVQGQLALPSERYSQDDDVLAFQARAIARLERIPGAEAVSISYGLPYMGLRGMGHYVADVGGGTLPVTARINGVSPGYFRVTGTRLVAGRFFNDTDTAGSTRVAIIGEGMARQLFPHSNPLGRRVASASSDPPAWMEVVGVVADVRPIDVAQEPAPFQLYQPTAQDPRREWVLAVRLADGTPGAVASIRSAIAELDPDLSVRRLMTATNSMQEVTTAVSLVSTLLTGFAVVGLFLASLGIYGAMTRMVAQRTDEIGLRMALGAQVRDVLGLVLRSGVRMVAIGAGIGLAGAFALSAVLGSVFPSMESSIGLAGSAAIALLTAVALLACYLPARRATQVDPVVALRSE